MVIATAIVNEANCIYSTDRGMKAFADGYIDVRELPPLKDIPVIQQATQQALFPDSRKP